MAEELLWAMPASDSDPKAAAAAAKFPEKSSELEHVLSKYMKAAIVPPAPHPPHPARVCLFFFFF